MRHIIAYPVVSILSAILATVIHINMTQVDWESLNDEAALEIATGAFFSDYPIDDLIQIERNGLTLIMPESGNTPFLYATDGSRSISLGERSTSIRLDTGQGVMFADTDRDMSNQTIMLWMLDNDGNELSFSALNESGCFQSALKNDNPIEIQGR